MSGTSPAVGSNVFSWPSHTHQLQPGAESHEVASCFLSPLCKGAVAITVAAMDTPRKQTVLPSALGQGSGEKGIRGYGFQSEEPRATPSPEPG